MGHRFTAPFVVALAVAAPVGLAVAGCSGSVCERPAEARRIVSDGHILQFQEAGVDFFCGDHVPSLAGTYRSTDAYIAHHDEERMQGTAVCDAEYTITPTDDPAVYSVTRVLTQCVGETETTESYASGDGDCFTLYSQSEGTFEGCETSDLGIFTGCLADGGIDVPQWAGLALRREGASCEGLYNQGRTSLEGQAYAIETQGEFLPRIDD
jgi:hypothetical protein